MHNVLMLLSSVIQLYSLVCLIYILLSWSPGLKYSSIGVFLASICEPFLNWFRRFSFTRIGIVDFSPILALGVLSILSSTFQRLAVTGKLSLGFIIAGLIQIIWSFFSFLLTLILLFLFVRIIYDFLFSKQVRSNFWIMLDNFLNPIINYVSRLFFRNRNVSYRMRLITSFVSTLIVKLGIEIAVSWLYIMLSSV